MRGRGEIAVRDAVDRFVPKLGLAGLRERYMDARGDHLLDQAKFHVVGGGKFLLIRGQEFGKGLLALRVGEGVGGPRGAGGLDGR